MKKRLRRRLSIILIGIIIVCSILLWRDYKLEENVKNSFSELIETSKVDVNNSSEIGIDLNDLYKQNNDLVGWIKINGTNIDFPLMKNKEYYLRRDFQKNKSKYGVPFIAEYCDMNDSDNVIIYGHNMKNGTMFAELEKYEDKTFYDDNSEILIYLISNGTTIQRKYKIFSVFKVKDDENEFEYFNFTNATNENEYNSFIEDCKKRSIYPIDREVKYKDKLITISTCEYSQKNGRLVIVANEVK